MFVGQLVMQNIDLPGSEDLGDVIADEFKKGYKAIIMENHGTVLGGSNLTDAFERFEALEFCARTILYGSQIGTPNYLTDAQTEEFEAQATSVLPEMEITEYPSDEVEKRAEICKIVQRSCQQGLMIGSYGTVSMRWKDNDFLITPTGINRWDLELMMSFRLKTGNENLVKNLVELHGSIKKFIKVIQK